MKVNWREELMGVAVGLVFVLLTLISLALFPAKAYAWNAGIGHIDDITVRKTGEVLIHGNWDAGPCANNALLLDNTAANFPQAYTLVVEAMAQGWVIDAWVMDCGLTSHQKEHPLVKGLWTETTP